MKKLQVFLISMLSFITPIALSLGSAGALVRPSGMIVQDSGGAYYYTYYTPGTSYSDPRLKYIGHGEVLSYYQNRNRKAYTITDTEKSGYTVHNHNLTFPCGEAARDQYGKIAFFEPLGWPPGAQDQGDPVFSYAENFPQYVGFVNWDHSGSTGSHHQDILKESGYNQISTVDGLPEGVTGGIYPGGVPNCVIVKQTNSPDYYRVFRHQTPTAVEVERKVKIQTPEILDLWTNFNSYTYETDITSLPSVGSAKMPPGLLVRTIANSNVYFTDDEGYKVLIPTQAKFDELGFNPGDVTIVEQSTLNTTPTKILY